MNVFEIDSKVDTILTDIEGTTTSISFVKEILFPYARNALEEYLVKNITTEECQNDLILLRKQLAEDNEKFGEANVPQILNGDSPTNDLIESIKSNVFWMMDNDRKVEALKSLQGHIWKFAYEKNLVKGHIYDDVVPAFERLLGQGKQVVVYSSGSVQAQKLLFQYSDKGDLLKYFSGHFDTKIGMKMESSSYLNILKEINKEPEQVLFLTDLIKEAVAAKAVNVNVCLLRRPDNPDKETANFQWVTSFQNIH